MAKQEDFPPDTRVQYYNSAYRVGTVIGASHQQSDVVAVEWDDGSLSRENVDDLYLENSLDKEFLKLQEKVNEKLDQAACLIKEAASLAATEGKNLQDWNEGENTFDYYVIEGAMKQAGWNTSSWHC